jgi:hypothetical protein
VARDPFGTAELRRRVLDAWRASPARFRADANVEDDLALTGYRDRVIVELAQNAADAAARAGIPGRLTLELRDATLIAANTGTPLDAAGVESIAVARASAKAAAAETVGRFGVGFAAVLAVTDEPSIVSASAAVRWSRAEAVAALSEIPELADVLADRGDRVPVLRLPLPVDMPALTDADTEVVLPLRDDDAVQAVRAQLTGLDPTLVMALPSLAEIVIELDGGRRTLRADRAGDITVLDDAGAVSRWHVLEGSGPLPADLLADRPAEEQRLDTWQVSWAIPVDGDRRVVALPDSVTTVVRAPTATDDALTLPAVLIATYPLDATRRRVTTGPLADLVTSHAADVLVVGLADLPPDPSLLLLVPTGFPNGEVDGAIHAAVLDAMARAAWLPCASDPDIRQRPGEAVTVPDGLVDVLAEVVPSVLPAGWSRPELTALGVRQPELGDLLASLTAADREPAWWQRLYAALDAVVPAGHDRDALGTLPVPLGDGSMVIGPRGLALPDPQAPLGDLSAVGVRIVHPDAVHELLRSLGAVEGTARQILDQPSVRAAVEASYDDDDPAPIADAVLSLLAATGVGADDLPWLSDLALTGTDGEWRPAGELVLPDGVMAGLIADDSAFGTVASDWVQRYGAAPVVAAGVVDQPVVLRAVDAVGPRHDLDDEAAWWQTLPPDCAIEEFVAVRDLEQIRDDGFGRLLDSLARPPLRAAVVEPAILTLADGRRQRDRSYTAWWLSRRPVLGGQAPRDLRLAASDDLLAGLYDVAASALDDEMLRALGVLATIGDADPDDVLARLADSERTVSRDQLRGLYAWLSTAHPAPPASVRAMRGGEAVVVGRSDAVVVDAPDLLDLVGDRSRVPVSLSYAVALAERVDLPLASELATYEVRSSGQSVDDAIHHDRLLVADADGVQREVAWRYLDDTLHVHRGRLANGLGRGRAWRDGVWSQRHRRTEALLEQTGGRMRDDEDDLDDPEE